jgi:hypothetical protein
MDRNRGVVADRTVPISSHPIPSTPKSKSKSKSNTNHHTYL